LIEINALDVVKPKPRSHLARVVDGLPLDAGPQNGNMGVLVVWSG